MRHFGAKSHLDTLHKTKCCFPLSYFVFPFQWRPQLLRVRRVRPLPHGQPGQLLRREPRRVDRRLLRGLRQDDLDGRGRSQEESEETHEK